MDSVARKEPRFLHLFTTLLLNRKYNPLPPIYYCKSDTFSVHRFIFLEKLFAGILDYFGSKLWRTNTSQKICIIQELPLMSQSRSEWKRQTGKNGNAGEARLYGHQLYLDTNAW